MNDCVRVCVCVFLCTVNRFKDFSLCYCISFMNLNVKAQILSDRIIQFSISTTTIKSIKLGYSKPCD